MYNAIIKVAECLSNSMTKTALSLGTGAGIGAIGNVGLAALHNRRAGEVGPDGQPIKRKSYIGAAFGGAVAGGAAGHLGGKFMGTQTGQRFGKAWDRNVRNITAAPKRKPTAVPKTPPVP